MEQFKKTPSVLNKTLTSLAPVQKPIPDNTATKDDVANLRTDVLRWNEDIYRDIDDAMDRTDSLRKELDTYFTRLHLNQVCSDHHQYGLAKIGSRWSEVVTAVTADQEIVGGLSNAFDSLAKDSRFFTRAIYTLAGLTSVQSAIIAYLLLKS